MRRIRTSRLFRSPFKNIALESGLGDEQAVCSVQPPIDRKTFARLRNSPPKTITLDQLLMIARLAASTAPVGSADVLGMLRDPDRYLSHPFYSVLVADIYERSFKQLILVTRMVRAIAPTIGHVYLYDNDDSLAYLGGKDQSQCVDSFAAPTSAATSTLLSQSSGPAVRLRYQRRPRVSAVLTSGSLQRRQSVGGDASIEHLLGNVEVGEHSLNVVANDPAIAHRVLRGVFADAQAAAIFGRKLMVVLPRHQRTLRVYHCDDPRQAELIAESICFYRHMRRFAVHQRTQAAVVEMLGSLLSYRLPGRSANVQLDTAALDVWFSEGGQ